MSGTRQATKTKPNTTGEDTSSTSSLGESLSLLSSASHRLRQDGNNNTWIDRALDTLREHRLHPGVEAVTSWLVAALCLTYYGYVFLSGMGRKQQRVPLMTEVPKTNQ
jgi:hypothetical protein